MYICLGVFICSLLKCQDDKSKSYLKQLCAIVSHNILMIFLTSSAVCPQIYTEMEEAEELLKRQTAQLECSLRGVLKEDFLERYISAQHWDSLCIQPVSLSHIQPNSAAKHAIHK